ncbi:MAG: ASKHA domain-containing protein [Anaerolineales bacterium]
MTLTIDFEPLGRRARVPATATLLEAAQSAGVQLIAVCGGAGVCGKCRVRCVTGQLAPPTASERAALSAAELEAGYRLACQATPDPDAPEPRILKIELPPASLSAQQRLQLEAETLPIAPDPVIMPATVTVPPPRLARPEDGPDAPPADLRADTVRLAAALAEKDIPRPFFGQPVLRELSTQLRAHDGYVKLAIRTLPPFPEVVGLLPPSSAPLGLAVDIGTTKIAAYLVDLTTGQTLAQDGVPNPQIAYGEDVVNRIAYANQHSDGREILQSALITALNQLITTLTAASHTSPEAIVENVVVGNTVIHHLFAGLPVRQLGEAPYIAAASEALDISAAHLGLNGAAGAKIYLPPNIAGYVGADHVAMLLATRSHWREHPTIALDIGTNTEISLILPNAEADHPTILSCSCASGPAFEGAHIHDGMRAAPGAIEHVQIYDGAPHWQTVRAPSDAGPPPPVGICGSGILDAVAELRRAGVLNRAGRMRPAPYGLVPAEETGHGRDILITRKDVHEIQLAKSAIRAGIEILLREAHLTPQDLGRFVVAGAFGSYLDLDSAVAIGMFPDLPRECFRQVGNAAGAGARRLLISQAQRQRAAELAAHVAYIELTTHPDFNDLYVEAMYL